MGCGATQSQLDRGVEAGGVVLQQPLLLLTHAHEAALKHHRPTAHPEQYDRFYQQHESERLAGHIQPPKAANVIPASVGKWTCAPLQAPKPRHPIQGGDGTANNNNAQQQQPGEMTTDWEERGVLFWHVETVGSTIDEAARLIHKMEDLDAGPVCNQATEETRDHVRFLGRYTIWDYGTELPTNQSLEEEDPHKVTIGHSEDDITHFDILLGDDYQDVSLGSVCYFATVEEYWDHFTTDLFQ